MAEGVLNARQQQIMDRMALDGEVKLAELKEMFDVAEMTLRRDLEKLEQIGLVRRTFGGAILVGTDIALQDRTVVLLEEKMRIGRKAAQLVQPGDSVFIDGGSTTLQVAKFLPAKMNVTVVTNALNIAAELLTKQIATIVVGGVAIERTSTLVGPIAAAALSKMAFHRAFLGTTGVTASHGFSNSNMYEAEIKQLAMAQSAEVNVVADHTKFGTKDLFSFAALDKADRIISDSEPASELMEAFAQASVEIIV